MKIIHISGEIGFDRNYRFAIMGTLVLLTPPGSVTGAGGLFV